ncbi:hypothetical protein Tco_1456731 [Tanacetum coccineum]
MPISDEALQEYCDRNYHQILPIIAEKVHQEKVQQEKLKAVKARLNFEEASHHSESGTPTRRRGLKERLGPRHVHSRSESPEPRRGRSELPKKKGLERKTVFKRLEKGVFHRLGDKGKSVSVYSDDSRRRSYHSSRINTESCHQSSRSRTTEPASERHYNKRASSKRTEELPESEGSAEGHWKSRVKRAKSSVEDDMSQPWRDGESTEEFVRRYKLECKDVKGAPEGMKISGFMHGITNPKLIKRLHDKIPKSVDKMMRQEANQKQIFKKGGFRNQQRSKRKQDHFALLTKTPKEIFALDKGKFKAPPPMTTPVEKRNANKFCEFHGEVEHNTDECMHLRKQIEEMLKAGKLSHLVKEIKQNNRKEQPKVTKKGETAGKDKAMAILMVQP